MPTSDVDQGSAAAIRTAKYLAVRSKLPDRGTSAAPTRIAQVQLLNYSSSGMDCDCVLSGLGARRCNFGGRMISYCSHTNQRPGLSGWTGVGRVLSASHLFCCSKAIIVWKHERKQGELIGAWLGADLELARLNNQLRIVTVRIAHVEDGGVRAWSDDLAGLSLTCPNHEILFAELPSR